ncbi:hypothetical protein [Pseudomonas phage PPAT]|nr:hypothetical protein [Pseudomonas phage PPAT]
MKLIIAGSRDITPLQFEEALQEIRQDFEMEVTEIVSGNARGVDKYGEQVAKENSLALTVFKPDWSKGKPAGIIRNKEMGDYADALFAVWDGQSKGTKHMIDYMIGLGKPVQVVIK